MAMHEDEDVKIASGSFKKEVVHVDSGEEAARQFLEQKNCGNIDKARILGKDYANAIINIETGPVAQEGKPRTQRELHHRLILYSYIVNRVIAECSPNSIVAQTCLNVFYTAIEEASAELYKHVSDMAAFSLYVLCERSPSRSDAEIGAIYAELCDFDGREDIVKEGNDFYVSIYRFCLDKLDGIGYVDTRRL